MEDVYKSLDTFDDATTITSTSKDKQITNGGGFKQRGTFLFIADIAKEVIPSTTSTTTFLEDITENTTISDVTTTEIPEFEDALEMETTAISVEDLTEAPSTEMTTPPKRKRNRKQKRKHRKSS